MIALVSITNSFNAVYTGSVLCGVIDEPVPQLVAIGKSITTVLAITAKAKGTLTQPLSFIAI